MSQYPVSKRLQAFTLIELLTVIAIIGVLAAILIPALGKVRNSANVAKSMSNLRQLGTLMNAYAVENSNRYVFTQDRDGVWWADNMVEFAGLSDREAIQDLFICPVVGGDIDLSNGSVATSYAAHEHLLGKAPDGDNNPNNDRNGVPLVSIARPSEQIMLATGAVTQGNGGTTMTFWMPWQGFTGRDLNEAIPVPADPTGSFGHMGYHLNGSVGVVMVDGHVEQIPLGEVKWRNYLPLVN